MTTPRNWNGRVFIGTSVDGQVARADGTLAWLTELGEAAGDAGYSEFISHIDAMLMGRATYDVISAFPEWPYGDLPVIVLSTTMQADSDDRVRVAASLDEATALLAELGATGVYLDGARTIQACLNAGYVDELTISQVPVLIGAGIRLFGDLDADIRLEHLATTVLEGGMVQTKYRVMHSQGSGQGQPG